MNTQTSPPFWRPSWLLTIIAILTVAYGAVVSKLTSDLQTAKKQNKVLQSEVDRLKAKYE